MYGKHVMGPLGLQGSLSRSAPPGSVCSSGPPVVVTYHMLVVLK